MAFTYLEKVRSVSPNASGFGRNGGKATYTYYVRVNGAADLGDLQADILGTVNYGASTFGNVVRSSGWTPGSTTGGHLPRAHPVWPWLYADSISSIRGMGQYDLENAEPTLDVAPITSQFALQDIYEITVEFTSRIYAITSDDYAALTSGSWYNDAGTAQNFNYVTEWERYTDWTPVAREDIINAQKGQYIFQSTSSQIPTNSPFNQMPRLTLPNAILSVKWYNVPYRYILSTNSYITGGSSTHGDWRGRINQNDWWNWKAGQLLYLNYAVEKYNGTLAKEVTYAPGVLATDKYCDITFTFLLTSRPLPAGDLPVGLTTTTRPGTGLGSGPYLVANKNYIAAGHNLQNAFSLDRKWHFVTTTDATNKVGIFQSFPVELLFMDPDSAGGLT